MSMEWQPIEKARGDDRGETKCLLWCADQRSDGKPVGVVMGRIWERSNGDIQADGQGMLGDWNFTHWMPLPSEPTPA